MLNSADVFVIGSCPAPLPPLRFTLGRTTLARIMTKRAVGLGIDLLWQSVVMGISIQEIQLGKRRIRS